MVTAITVLQLGMHQDLEVSDKFQLCYHLR